MENNPEKDFFGSVIFIVCLITLFWVISGIVKDIGDFMFGEGDANPSNYDYPTSPDGSELGTNRVDPHWVDGYERSDGTQVDGYWRGGDDGYERGNPDGDPSNNLDSSGSDSGGDFDIESFDILGF